jgi:anti-sigma factor RsiW
MNCCEFREKYSDYTDGLLTAVEASEARLHMGVCEGCRRFDAAFRAGIGALRTLPAVGMSRGFGPRLRAKLRREFTVRVPVMATWSGAMGTLLLVATVGAVGWDLLTSRTARHDTLPVGRTAPAWPSASVAVPAQGPVALVEPYDSIITSPDAFHPLQSALVQSALAATTAQVATVGGDRPRFDLSVVWGGP